MKRLQLFANGRHELYPLLPLAAKVNVIRKFTSSNSEAPITQLNTDGSDKPGDGSDKLACQVVAI